MFAVHQALEVADERLGAAVELLVEALDDVLLEDAGAAPLAVRAAQRDLPVRGAGLLPLDRVDEVGAAGRRRRGGRVDARRRAGAASGDRTPLVLEVDDLDGLARGKHDAADVVVDDRAAGS